MISFKHLRPVSARPLPCNHGGFVRGYAIMFAALVLFILIEVSGCNLSSYSNSGPSPELLVVQATDLGPIPTNSDILGRDGAFSTLFQGVSVWLFGDTFLARPDAQNRTLLSDSWSFTSDLNAQGGLTGFQERLDATGAPTMILPETATEQAFNQAHNVNNCQAQPCGGRWALYGLPQSWSTLPIIAL